MKKQALFLIQVKKFSKNEIYELRRVYSVQLQKKTLFVGEMSHLLKHGVSGNLVFTSFRVVSVF